MIIRNGQFNDLSSLEVLLAGQDITEAVNTIHIFQDLLSPCWSVEIEIIDTVNIISRNAIKGGETISIALATNQKFDTDGSYNFDVVVSEISDRFQISQSVTGYIIKCVAEPIVKNQEIKIKKAYKNKKIEDIVKSIASEIGITLGDKACKMLEPHTEIKNNEGVRLPSKTEGEYTWIATNKSPLNCIGYLMGAATYNGNSDFVFFQKSSNKWTFASLRQMWKRKKMFKFVQRPNFIKDDNSDYKKNKNLEFSTFTIDHFSKITNIASGYTGCTLMTFDTIKKEWKINAKGDNSDAIYKFSPIHEQMFDEGKNVLEDSPKWWTNRHLKLFAINQELVKLQLPGTVQAFDWLSECCELEFPINDSMVENRAKLDKEYSGKYMIVAVGHHITKNSYSVNIELTKGLR